MPNPHVLSSKVPPTGGFPSGVAREAGHGNIHTILSSPYDSTFLLILRFGVILSRHFHKLMHFTTFLSSPYDSTFCQLYQNSRKCFEK